MKTLSLKVLEALDLRLSRLVANTGVSKSDAIRAALEAYLEAAGNAANGSVLDLAGDLTGCVKGPGDLSTHPRHMKTYRT